MEEKVYSTIKDKIICHEIKSRKRLFDKSFAEQLSVSRSLIRQVFTTLVKEEFLEFIPRNGFYVRKISKKELKEIFDIRKIVESYATKLSVPRISQRDIDALEKCFEKAKQDLDKDEVKSFIEMDVRLHSLLVSNTGNKYLSKIIDRYNDKYVFFRIVDLYRIKRAKESYYEHYLIFKAVKEKKEELASRLLVEYIEKSKKIILDNFKEYNNGYKKEKKIKKYCHQYQVVK